MIVATIATFGVIFGVLILLITWQSFTTKKTPLVTVPVSPATPVQKQKWQYKIPECPPQLLGWLFIILIGFGCAYVAQQFFKGIEAYKQEVRVSKMSFKKVVFLQPNQRELLELHPKEKKDIRYIPTLDTFVMYLDENKVPTKVICDGRLVDGYIESKEKPLKSLRFIDGQKPPYVVFVSMASQPYSFIVEEY